MQCFHFGKIGTAAERHGRGQWARGMDTDKRNEHGQGEWPWLGAMGKARGMAMGKGNAHSCVV